MSEHDPCDISVQIGAQVEHAHGQADINCIEWAPADIDGAAPCMLASAGDDGEVRILT